jgi:hypothetical protein
MIHLCQFDDVVTLSEELGFDGLAEELSIGGVDHAFWSSEDALPICEFGVIKLWWEDGN